MSETDTAAKPAEAAQTPQTTADEKSQPTEEKPQPMEGVSKTAEEKPPAEEKPQPVEEKPQSVEEKPQSVEEKPQSVEEKPPSEEEKPQSAEEKPQSVEDKPKPVEEKSESKDAEMKPDEATPGSPREQPKSVEASTGTDQNSGKMLKTKAAVDREKFRNNCKFDPSVREVTDDPDAIRKQVEFYFGDWNFPQDKFMWESCEGTTNKPMPISKIHSFKRMRTFQPYSAVVAALRGSRFLEVSGDEGQEVVKRKVPYKPMGEGRAKTEAATIYVKGFGDENPDTQFDLESFFAKYGEIKGLKLRRTNEGLFKGSVFVTFPDEEAAKAFVNQDPAPTYKGNELKIMSKRDYCEEKSDLIRQGLLEPNSTSQKKFFEGRDGNNRGFRDNNRRGNHNGDDWKKRREQDQKNGFQDRRGGGRGRGGRGRGQGQGRGHGGRDGAGRGRDSRREDGDRRDKTNDARPRIQSTAEEGGGAAAATGSKRAREEDGGAPADAPAAKKIDAKAEAKAEAT